MALCLPFCSNVLLGGCEGLVQLQLTSAWLFGNGAILFTHQPNLIMVRLEANQAPPELSLCAPSQSLQVWIHTTKADPQQGLSV